MSRPKTMTTAAGCPVADNQNAITTGPRGPVLMHDVQLFEKMAHFNRERVPKRVVRAKGAGAYGTFSVGTSTPARAAETCRSRRPHDWPAATPTSTAATCTRR